MKNRSWVYYLVLIGILDTLALALIVWLAPQDKFFLWYAEKNVLLGAVLVLADKKINAPSGVKMVLYSFVCIFLAH